MISYLRLENFKSFSNIELNLRGAHGIPKKMAFIYGENGSGKSNLLLAMLFIQQTFETIQFQMTNKNVELPAIDEIEGGDFPNEIINFIKAMQSRYSTLPELIERYWMIGNDDPMRIEIGFYHAGKEGFYEAAFSRKKIIEEKLYYTLNERSGVLFHITEEKKVLSPSVFIEQKYKAELVDLLEKYWGKHTFMSILYGERSGKNDDYVEQRVSGNLLSILKMFRQISTLHKGGNQETARIAVPFRFLQRLEEGEIKSRQDKELLAFEKALNVFFTQLYSDVKRVYYQFKKGNAGYHYELYFDKVCGNTKRAIPVSMESTGTKKLLDVFPLLFSCALGTSVFVDEIDTGIHDLLMKDAITIFQEALGERKESQFIATTHNTLLLDSLAPENVYIINSKSNGEKEIICVNEYGFRTQKNNSIRHKYIQGFYEGIPNVGYLDFWEIVKETVVEARVNPDKKEE